MRMHCGNWLGPCLLAAAFVVMPAACPVARAQPGFGPDPFWPYNSQYTPYTEPIGPAEPAAGGRGDMYRRDGGRGANQFQQYLDGLQGGGSPGRSVSDRAGIGMPYYRSSVSPLYGPAGSRQYEPNRRSNQSFEQAQKRVADRYFEYYAQRDPAKRADLLREYRAARRDAQYATTGREGSSARGLASPSSRDRGAGRAGDLGSAAGRTGVLDRTGAGGDRFGPAPEVPGIGSARSSAAPRSRESTPTDVLNRSRAMDRAGGVRSDRAPSVPGPRSRRPGSGAGTGTRPGSAPSSRSATRGTRPPATDAPARDRDNP